MTSIKVSGQGLVAYVLILAFIAVVTVVVLSALGEQVSAVFADLPFFQAQSDEAAPFLTIKDDFLARINAYYEANDRWPHSWSTYRFTDLGLNPEEWDGPIEGIYWNPHGSNVGLANYGGDNLQLYVNDLDGNPLHLYDGWNIWCQASDGKCYYHTVAPENEIDITTLIVVEE